MMAITIEVGKKVVKKYLPHKRQVTHEYTLPSGFSYKEIFTEFLIGPGFWVRSTYEDKFHHLLFIKDGDAWEDNPVYRTLVQGRIPMTIEIIPL